MPASHDRLVPEASSSVRQSRPDSAATELRRAFVGGARQPAYLRLPATPPRRGGADGVPSTWFRPAGARPRLSPTRTARWWFHRHSATAPQVLARNLPGNGASVASWVTGAGPTTRRLLRAGEARHILGFLRSGSEAVSRSARSRHRCPALAGTDSGPRRHPRSGCEAERHGPLRRRAAPALGPGRRRPRRPASR